MPEPKEQSLSEAMKVIKDYADRPRPISRELSPGEKEALDRQAADAQRGQNEDRSHQ